VAVPEPKKKQDTGWKTKENKEQNVKLTKAEQKEVDVLKKKLKE